MVFKEPLNGFTDDFADYFNQILLAPAYYWTACFSWWFGESFLDCGLFNEDTSVLGHWSQSRLGQSKDAALKRPKIKRAGNAQRKDKVHPRSALAVFPYGSSLRAQVSAPQGRYRRENTEKSEKHSTQTACLFTPAGRAAGHCRYGARAGRDPRLGASRCRRGALPWRAAGRCRRCVRVGRDPRLGAGRCRRGALP